MIDQLTIDQLIDNDLKLYGKAYYYIDERGNKTRIDPTRLTVVEQNGDCWVDVPMMWGVGMEENLK